MAESIVVNIDKLYTARGKAYLFCVMNCESDDANGLETFQHCQNKRTTIDAMQLAPSTSQATIALNNNGGWIKWETAGHETLPIGRITKALQYQ